MAIYPNPNYNYQQPMVNPNYSPIPNYQQPHLIDTGIIWVQGESGAKAYPVQSGKSMVLFDSESERFFIKSADISGMPQPLRVFNYSETKENEIKQQVDTSQFITREEFEIAINSLKHKPQNNNQQKEVNKNGKPTIQ